MKIYYKKANVNGKIYYNFYLGLENGIMIPIEVKLFKKDGKYLNGKDYTFLKAIAQPYEK